MIKYSFLLLSTLSIVSCTTATLRKEEAAIMPPLALCTEYRHYSKLVTNFNYERESLLSRLQVLYAEIEKKNVDCKSILPPEPIQQGGGKGVVNCMPNKVTGGVSCF